MSTHIGSVAFMLRHEMRLHWRSMGMKMRAGIAVVLLVVGLHLFAWPIAFIMTELPPFARAEVLLVTSFALGSGLLAMVSTSLIAVIKLIYERRDFDLLLSSPIDPFAVIVSRCIGIMATGVMLSLALVAPFANMFAIYGSPHLLALYPVVICLGLLSATLSLLLGEGLFRLIGARHARIVAQVVGLLIGSVLVIGVNLQYLTSNIQQQAIDRLHSVAAGLPGPESWLWWPARAALGEIAPLLALVALSVLSFIAVTFVLANSLLSHSREAAGATVPRRSKRAGIQARPFRGGTRAIMRRKELRLLARDPYLLAQILYQVIGVVPVVFMLWKGSGNWPALAWVSLVLGAGIIASNLAWITISAEDSPDLLAVSPVSERDTLRAKLEAALIPVAALCAAPIAAAAAIDPWLGLTLLLCCPASAISAALVNLRYRKAAKRSEFNTRVTSGWLVWLLEYIVAAAWTGIAVLMLLKAYVAVVPAIFLLGFVVVLWRTRSEQPALAFGRA